MKRSRFSEEQIIGILKEHQAGLGAKELWHINGLNGGKSGPVRHWFVNRSQGDVGSAIFKKVSYIAPVSKISATPFKESGEMASQKGACII